MENDLIIEDKRNDFVDLTPYLIPETSKIIEEINSKIPDEVRLRKVYDPLECWQIRKSVPTHIDMPLHQEGDIILFTHELLHIYFDFVLGMRVGDTQVLNFTSPYNDNTNDPWIIAGNFINMINNLQHHKMIPYFESFNFPREKIILNYTNPVEVYQSLEQFIEHNINYENPVERYHYSLVYVNYIIMEYYFPNPLVREKLKTEFSERIDKKLVGLRSQFQPIIEKWDSDYNNLKELLSEINFTAHRFAEDLK